MVSFVRKEFGQRGKVHVGLNISSSAHNCGRVVDGGNAMAACDTKSIAVRASEIWRHISVKITPNASSL